MPLQIRLSRSEGGHFGSTLAGNLFSRSQRALVIVCHTTLAQVFVRVIPSMCHAPEWLSVLSSILTLLSSVSLPILHFFFLNLDFYFSSSMWVSSEQDPLCTSPNEESGPLANNAPLRDDFHYSETTEIFLQNNPATRGPRTCMTRRSVTRPSAERSLHHCSLRSAKNQRAVDKLFTLLKKVCCQVCRRLSVM